MNESQHVQTKREIASLLERAGIRPRKRFGQHFLIDGNLMRRLAASAGFQPDDVVLEVGPGTGGLTDLIVPHVARMICVEIDRDLFAILEDRFGDRGNVTLIQGDVLQGKHRLASSLGEMLRDLGERKSGCVKLVANLPYQVATPLVMNLLIDYPQVRRLCFSVQAEVGERITTGSGSKAYGPLSILTQTLCSMETVGKIPPSAFWPVPAVDSVILCLDVRPLPFADRDELRRFAALVRGAFDHRRKTLRAALGYVLEDRTREAVCRAVDGARRPESFRIDEWVGIHRVVEEADAN